MRRSMPRLLVIGLSLFPLLLGNARGIEGAGENGAAGNRSMESTASLGHLRGLSGLPSAYQVHAKLITGGTPDPAAGFAELTRLGIKTIISVDATPTNVAAARRAGLRYVHLPIGYDGVSAVRVTQLVKAVRKLPGPIYLHCHHGKHRGPAAAAVACLGSGLLTKQQARLVLEEAGTSKQYRGLYNAVEQTEKLTDAVLAAAEPFVEQAEVTTLAQAMMTIDRLYDRLDSMHESDAVPNYKTAASTALLIEEQFQELLRTTEVRSQPADFQEQLKRAKKAATQLRSQLSESSTAISPSLLGPLRQSCSTCHQQFRD